MFKTFLLSFVVSFALSIAYPAKGAALCATANNLVQNCGFETGNFSGWTLFGDTAHAGVDSADAHGGSFGAYLAGLGSFNAGDANFTFLSQNLKTTPGLTYRLSYYTAHFTNAAAIPDNIFAAAIDSNVIDNSEQKNVEDLPYSLAGPFTFVAASSSTNLEFLAEDANFYFSLDDVSVASTPEPASFSLVAIALCGLPLVSRRWRRAGTDQFGRETAKWSERVRFDVNPVVPKVLQQNSESE